MKILNAVPLTICLFVFVADRIEPGYGKFAFVQTLKPVADPIEDIWDAVVPSNANCDKPITDAQYRKFKQSIIGTDIKEILPIFEGAVCEVNGVYKGKIRGKELLIDVKKGKIKGARII